MLKITLLLCITFGVLFSMLYAFIQYENKKDGGKDSKSVLLITAAIFSAILTAVIAFLLFVLLGSTTLLDSVFSLQMGNHLLLQIGIPYFIYWIVVEPFVKKGGQQFIRNTVLTLLFIALIRFGAFYVIGAINHLSLTTNITLATGVSFILLILDSLYFFKKQSHV